MTWSCLTHRSRCFRITGGVRCVSIVCDALSCVAAGTSHAAVVATTLSPLSMRVSQAVITVFIPSRQWRLQLKLRPTDYLRDVVELVTARAADAFGEVITGFSEDGSWTLGDVGSAKVVGSPVTSTVATGGSASLLVTVTGLEPVFSQCPGKRFVLARVCVLNVSSDQLSVRPTGCPLVRSLCSMALFD
jgi:hypothetical protein